MKTSEFIAIEKRLLEKLSDFQTKGRLIFATPLGPLLRGINFEGSSFNKTDFYVTQFVMPLCVPREHLYFTFGDRVRNDNNSEGWNVEMLDCLGQLRRAMQRQCLPFLARVATLDGFIAEARSDIVTVRTLEGLGYALARAGRIGEALATFDLLISRCGTDGGWVGELADQVRGLRALLEVDPAGAMRRLDATEAATVHALKLEKFWTPTSSSDSDSRGDARVALR